MLPYLSILFPRTDRLLCFIYSDLRSTSACFASAQSWV